MSQFEVMKKREEAVICRTYGRYPVAIKNGKGCRLWDFDGKEYVDLLAGIAVVALGHCNEELAEVMEKQAKKFLHVSNLFYQEEQLDFAERILATNHCGKALLCNSGAEANEAAIKLARRYCQKVKENGKYGIISFSGCFHGRTMATVALGPDAYKDGFSPMPGGFTTVPVGDMNALKAAVDDTTAAVILEMIQGESGVVPMEKAFVQELAAFCREKGILFIADEVQAGLCRSGKWWAFQHYGVEPDIVTSAKGVANGLPLGVMMATEEVATGFAPGAHGTTFGGNAFACAVGAKVLEIMERDNMPAKVAETGAWAMERFREVAKKFPGSIEEVRGQGLLIGIVLTKPGKEIWQALLDKGFICNLAHDTVLRLLPPLTVPKEDLDAFARALEEILSAQK